VYPRRNHLDPGQDQAGRLHAPGQPEQHRLADALGLQALDAAGDEQLRFPGHGQDRIARPLA
jgi:hypothetical protein